MAAEMAKPTSTSPALATATETKINVDTLKGKQEPARAGGESAANSDAPATTSGEKKGFLDEVEEKVNKWLDLRDRVWNKLVDRIDESYDKLPTNTAADLYEKHDTTRTKLLDKFTEKSKDLEQKYPDETRPVGYYVSLLEMEASDLKKRSQAYQKEEEAIDKELKKTEYYKNNKEEYEKERAE